MRSPLLAPLLAAAAAPPRPAAAPPALPGAGYHGRLTRLTLRDPSLTIRHGVWRDDADWYWHGQPGLHGCYASEDERCRAEWAFRGRSLRLFGSFDGAEATLSVDGAAVRTLTAGGSNASRGARELWSGAWPQLRPRTLSVDVAPPPGGDDGVAATRPALPDAAAQPEGLLRLKYAEVLTGQWYPQAVLACGASAGAAPDGDGWDEVGGVDPACGAPGVECDRRRSLYPGTECHLEAAGRGFRVWHSVGARARVAVDGVSVGVLSRAGAASYFAAPEGGHVLTITAAGAVEIAGVEAVPDDGEAVVAVNAGGGAHWVGGGAYAADDDDALWATSDVVSGAPGDAPEKAAAALTPAAAAALGAREGFAALPAPLPPDLLPLLGSWRRSAPGHALALTLPAQPGMYELRVWLVAAVQSGFFERTHSGRPSNAAAPPAETERRAAHVDPSAPDPMRAPQCDVPVAAWFTQAPSPHAGWGAAGAPGASVVADPYSGLYCEPPCGDGGGVRTYDFRAEYACAPRLRVSVDGYNILSPTGAGADAPDLGALTGGALHGAIELRHMVQVQESGLLEIVVAPPPAQPYGAAVHAAGLFAKDCSASGQRICFD